MLKAWRRLGVWVLLLAAAVGAVKLRFYTVRSHSMADTLVEGDMVVVSVPVAGAGLLGTGLRLPGSARPQRGEIWVVERSAETPNALLVKRVVGVAGDTLAMRRGVISLNGRVLPSVGVGRTDVRDVSHVLPRGEEKESDGIGLLMAEVGTSEAWGPVVVPVGHVFVLGDNRSASRDSRRWGPLPVRRLRGRVRFIYFSIDPRPSWPRHPFLDRIRWKRIGRPGTDWVRD